RDESAAFADLFAGHFAKGLAITTNRTEQNDKILHAACKSGTSNQPQRSRKVTELRSQGWTDERAGSGNRGKVVAEQNPFVGGHKVATVIAAFGRSGSRIIQSK